MGRLVMMDELLLEAQAPAPGAGPVWENWGAAGAELARWEDDGGRVLDRSRSCAVRWFQGAVANRAGRATAQ